MSADGAKTLWEGSPGDVERLLGETPLPVMASSIVELRRHGFDDLATQLTKLREQWARAVFNCAKEHDAAHAQREASAARKEAYAG